MNSDLLLIIILLLINLVVTIIYLILHIRKKDINRGIIMSVFFLAVPIFGFCLVLLAELGNFIVHQTRRKEVQYHELSFSKERAKFITGIDMVKELDTVPLEEAMNVANKKNRRQAFMDILKNDDYDQLMENITDAVDSDDQEISHYAATFVTDTLARYKSREGELRKVMDDNPTPENIKNYINYMAEIMEKDLFSPIELKQYTSYLDEAASALYVSNPAMLSDARLALLISCWIKAGEKERSNYWMSIARSRCRYSLICFKICMDDYFRHGERDELFYLLDEIKRSGLLLDSEALDWIRFFRKSEAQAVR